MIIPNSSMDPLFNDGFLSDFLDRRKKAFEQEIQQSDADYLLRISEQDYADYLVEKYAPDPPVLRTDEKYQDEPEDIRVDVSGDFNRDIRDRTRPTYMPGTRITIHIPFEGDRDLFSFRLSSFALSVPKAKIAHGEICLIYELANHDLEGLAREINSTIDSIQHYLGLVQENIAAFNQELLQLTRNAIVFRKQKLLADHNLTSELNIPVKRREDALKTYSVPNVQRKANIHRPSAPIEQPFEPEPVLEIQEYEHILGVMHNMVAVMERSPSAFADMGEEDLRQHFLVQLNGQYEGQATGETFNYQGKTDILIRYEGKNVFIAECKFWGGPKVLTGTIDQLLGYTTWRDTKTAILVFNRDTQFSTALDGIVKTTREHTCFVKELETTDETVFRYKFRQPNDPDRELWLTIMAFNIPVKIDDQE